MPLIVPPRVRHAIATIQLTEEEAARYRDVPIVIDFRLGFYVFPVRPFSPRVRLDSPTCFF